MTSSSRLARKRFTPLAIEPLEDRLLFSASMTFSPTFVNDGVVSTGIRPFSETDLIAAPFAPADVRGAYGINTISLGTVTGDGTGQTIAIIDAYNEPNIVSDESSFNTQFGLQQFNVSGGPTFSVLSQTGGSLLPANATKGTWDVEIALDVEWAHAVAPEANILLFEANSNSSANLYAAVRTAASYAGVSVVSMSFGATESSSELSSDSVFLTPSGHQGVTFVASAGDDASGALYPSASPNVVSVGGTSLSINADDSYGSETTWSKGGGGLSAYESQPAYQTGKVNGVSSTLRATPDVSMLADPGTGVYVLDTYDNSSYLEVGGTSLAAPMVGGLMAIADQGRALQGLGTLNGATQTLPMLYALPGSDFHDITTGSNGLSATAGYDLATGLGTPIANLLVPALAGYTASSITATQLAFAQQPTNAAAGSTLGAVTVDVDSASGGVVTTDASSVTLSILTGPTGGAIIGTATASAVNGVATFGALSFTEAGTYTLTATDGSLAAATSASFVISAASASQLAFAQQPTGATAGSTLTPAVTVAVEDRYGNGVSTDTSTVSLAIATGPTNAAITGSTTATAASGIATFSNLSFATAGVYTLVASDASLTKTTSSSFTVAAKTSGGSVSGSVLVGTTGLAGVTVYLDTNNNSVLDAGELSTTTSTGGAYSFSAVPAGAYVLRQVLPSGYHQVTPTKNYGDHETVTNGSAATAQNLVDAGNSISGSVKTASGAAVAGVTVYLDANNNAALDTGEQSTTTSSGGSYSFSAVPIGTYVVRQVLPATSKQTSPTNGYGIHVTVTGSAYAFTDENFVDAATASITGTVFNDANGNQSRNSTEAGLSGWTVYLDLNNSGAFTRADPSTTTTSNGAYTFTGLSAGTYIVRVVRPPTYKQTTPTNNFGIHVTLAATTAASGELFGEELIST